MLRESSDRRTLVFVATFFFSLVVAFAADPVHWGVTAAVTVWLCVMSFTCAVITHNTIHCPVFVSKRLNKLFQIVLTLAYGHPVSAYVPGHNLSHHMHTQTPRDVMRTTKLRFRWNLLNQILFLPVVAMAITRADSQYAKAMRTKRPAWFRQYMIEFGCLAATTVTLFLIDWQKALLFWVVPHAYAAWGIVGINYAQHDGCDEDHPYNHSRNFTGKLSNWWLFNNGYHAIHHDKPNLHWSKLPQAHEELIAPHNHPALNQPDLLAYFLKAYLWPGKRLRYDGEPVELPPRVADQVWIPGVEDHPVEASLGAES